MSRITFDGPPEPLPGDVLVTKTGRTHLVVSARQVRSRVSPARFALEVESPAPPQFTGREIPFRWYPRGPQQRA